VPFAVPASAGQLDIRFGWREDWSSFPTGDMDLILIKPDGTTIYDAATISNPESVSLANPQAGQWMALLQGFDIPSGSDKYDLRIAVDGQVLK
jgi:hypothetical protein